MKKITLFGLCSLLAAATIMPALGADFDYPELTVTPRASERIENEANKEYQRQWSMHLPLQLSALTTLTAGIMELSDTNTISDPDRVGFVGIGVGAGWLALSAYLATSYHPYSSSLKELKTMPSKTQREQLTRERFAEEDIKSIARLAKRLTIPSAVSNLGAGAYMIGKAPTGSFSRAATAASMVMAFAPVLFNYHWCNVAEEQADYKKRIYSVVASSAFFTEHRTGNLAPGATLSLFF